MPTVYYVLLFLGLTTFVTCILYLVLDDAPPVFLLFAVAFVICLMTANFDKKYERLTPIQVIVVKTPTAVIVETIRIGPNDEVVREIFTDTYTYNRVDSPKATYYIREDMNVFDGVISKGITVR